MKDFIFRLVILPARNGDALLIDYGTAGSIKRVLIDGGVTRTGPVIKDYLGDRAELELLVVTHIDSDHIGGVLNLLNASDPPAPEEVWFNGFRHLPSSNLIEMGPEHAEDLTALLDAGSYNWNGLFNGKAVARGDSPLVRSPVRTLPGGLKCTVLSPGPKELQRLRIKTTWAEIVAEAEQNRHVAVEDEISRPRGRLLRMGSLDIDDLADAPTPKDTTPANGSSIALLVEYANRRCLLAADAHPDVLIAGVDQLVGPENVLQVDVFKLPHHGSKANVTRDLLSRIQAHTYVFSTDGSGQQRHPNDEAVARVIKYGGKQPLLVFNYRSTRKPLWENLSGRQKYKYATKYPADGDEGIQIEVAAMDENGPRPAQGGPRSLR